MRDRARRPVPVCQSSIFLRRSRRGRYLGRGTKRAFSADGAEASPAREPRLDAVGSSYASRGFADPPKQNIGKREQCRASRLRYRTHVPEVVAVGSGTGRGLGVCPPSRRAASAIVCQLSLGENVRFALLRVRRTRRYRSGIGRGLECLCFPRSRPPCPLGMRWPARA
jgi:hypothetical protein